jgi:hypothetical protein
MRYSISPGGRSYPTAGGAGTISIIAASGCSWSGSSTAAWVTLNGSANRSGDGSISIQVAANSGAARVARLTVAGLPFIVVQAAVPGQ